MTPDRPAIVRPATDADLEAVRLLDRARVGSPSRPVDELLAKRPRRLIVATISDEVVGYVVLGAFFEYDFLDMLFVRADYRRKGIGSRLVAAAETTTQSGKLFTSTNESNKPMRSLCEKLGFVRSGFVDGLDAGDPEIFYMKPVSAAGQGQ